MKLATIAWRDGTSAALVVASGVAPVRALPGRESAVDVLHLIHHALEPAEVQRLMDLVEPTPTRWRPPILRPPKNIFCVGKNYVEHIGEGARAEGSKLAIPDVPVFFTKPATALIGSGDDIVFDPAMTAELDYEGELAVILARGGRNIRAEAALDSVYGYMILDDITARDLQQRYGQWFFGKGLDTFAPCGPWLVTADEIGDPQDLAISTRVDDQLRFQGTTSAMIFGVARLIAELSRGITLEPGDIISTGTPGGVAWGTDVSRYLRAGSSVAVEIERIGTLWNRVAARS